MIPLFSGTKLFFFLLVICIHIISIHCNKRRTYQNPLIPNENSPDPGVIFHKGAYYSVTTSNEVISNDTYHKAVFPIHRSMDLVSWELVGHVFPTHDSRPKWAEKDFWAPEIHILSTSNSSFHLYFTAREYNSNILCIGVAVSMGGILGPYVDLLGRPLLKNETVGNIDATVMSVPDASSVSGWIHYLLWKDDGNGNIPQIPTWIWAQQLSMDGMSLIGKKYPLIRNDLVWEGALVEGPWVIQYNKTWYLFYSANAFYNELYAVGVARSDFPLGPYVKYEKPILHSNKVWIGPGHCSVVPVNDYFVMIYHSWYQEKVGGDNYRLMLMDRLYWKDGWPFILNDSPSTDPQPVLPRSK